MWSHPNIWHVAASPTVPDVLQVKILVGRERDGSTLTVSNRNISDDCSAISYLMLFRENVVICQMNYLLQSIYKLSHYNKLI